jgi:hypothetical protein
MMVLEQCLGLLYVENKGCPGYCSDITLRNLAMYIVLDYSPNHLKMQAISGAGDQEVEMME